MASPSTVEVIKVAPPPGSLTTTTLPLTYLDLTWFFVPPVQRLFFYEFHHSRDYFFETVVPSLKHSLSVALQHFFPLVGNLTWPQDSSKPVIQYTEGNTVSLTVAESTNDFHSLLGNHARSNDEFYNLVPSFGALNPRDTVVPLMCLQVTLFPGSGICIGIAVNHVCADGRTSNHFLKSWASMYKSQGDDKISHSALPVYDRSNLADHKEKEETVLKAMSHIANICKDTFNNSISPAPPADMVRATFVMRPSDITKLRHWAMEHVTEELRLSSFALTCAYVWVCLIKSRKGSGNHRELFGFPVDGRDQLTPPLPTTYFGNCFGFAIVASTTNELVQEKGIAIAAQLIMKGIQDTRSNIWGSMERMYARPPFTEDNDVGLEKPDASMKYGHTVSVAGSPKLSVYETDFGWGKPKKVEVMSIGEKGAISLSESPSEVGALEVGMVGSSRDIDAFTSLYVNNLKSLLV